jgi:hypothetical protein
MNLTTFFVSYSTEESCKEFFKNQREKNGVLCQKCNCTSHLWIAKQNRWQCRKCKYRTGLKYGTVMENSNLSYKIWLWGLYLMSLTKKGFSALEMQRLIGHKRYEPIWLLMQKIRISMGKRDDKYSLDGFIEMDEGFFEGHRKKQQQEADKPVKELDRQVKAIVAISTTPVEEHKQQKHKPKTKAGYLKISVVSSLNKVEVGYEASKMIAKSASVITDGRRCYGGLQEHCKSHKTIIVQDKKQVSKIFPWVHTAISNVKKKILGLHHQVNDKYMQNYLSEFCYKHNRRHFGENLFDRLVLACIENAWYKPSA